MKNLTKGIIVGTAAFGCGTLIGFNACKKLMIMVVKDKKFLHEKIFPIIEEKIGQDKLERMAKIFYEKDTTPEVIFSKRSEAEEVLTTLSELMDKYKLVTVADFNDLIGQTSTFQDSKIGWTDLKNVNIQRVYTGYLFNLPKPQPIQ